MAANGQLVPAGAPTGPRSSALSTRTEDVAHQLQQFQKIIQFHDAIVAGSHPKVKLQPEVLAGLASLAGLATGRPTEATAQALSHAQTLQSSNDQSFAANALKSVVPGLGGTGLSSGATKNGAPKAFGAGSTQIDPIFLEKSDDLIRAEIQLQRQRLERALRDEVDQRRLVLKANAQAEPLSDLDIHDVLAKAQTLVQATTLPLPPPQPMAKPAGANETVASDSIDENSYYSSQHNSPDTSQKSSHGDRASVGGSLPDRPGSRLVGATRTHDQSQQKTQAQAYQQYYPNQPRDQGQAPLPPRPTATTSGGRPGAGYIPGIMSRDNTGTDNTTAESTSVGERSGDISRPDSGGMVGVERGAGRSVPSNLDQSRLRGSFVSHPSSPLVIAQSLAPVAPQPSRVSPLATARMPPQPAGHAQVAALRNEPTVISSPDSSPQSGKRNEAKKGKRKEKRKDKAPAFQAPELPYIKPEPLSPEPPSAPQFMRPQKRQKRQADHDNGPAAPERQPSRQSGEEYAYSHAPAYPGPDPYAGHRPPSRPAASSAYGYAPEYHSDRRVTVGAQPYAIQYSTPNPYVVSASPLPPAPAPMPMYAKEPPRAYHHSYDAPRMSARPEPPRAMSRSPMGPPTGPPLRVVVDASGRRYYEPPPPPPPSGPVVYRQSVPPPMRVDEPEILYERPVRAESRRPEYVEGGVVYRAEPPMYAPQRRVVTQPEYGVVEPHRAYRERDYISSRPMPPPPPEHYRMEERRPVEDLSRGYTMRATTARPAETIRYEVPMGYERVQSMRPDLAAHGYPAPAPPPGEVRREVSQPVPRAYSVRPPDAHVVPSRDYSARPPEGYYGQPVRQAQEMTYMEDPRGATHEIAYNEARPEYH
ncbi:hypothetical protein B0T11DRAFT_270628 [Plectosphaerella cucumerina]|uniref:Uncharacterized protein n=1 Tax=Plectosphaerella cucumerina TaxID=40658 RepID=A0A8K0TSG5_9PEZI|nr:hypothetical protein B0T11DRAFT_270628 [Plectosphaerella cucumerina]